MPRPETVSVMTTTWGGASSVGDVVGWPVGAREGLPDGWPVGLVGEDEGWDEGLLVGCPLGLREGFEVGRLEGCDVGDDAAV